MKIVACRSLTHKRRFPKNGQQIMWQDCRNSFTFSKNNQNLKHSEVEEIRRLKKPRVEGHPAVLVPSIPPLSKSEEEAKTIHSKCKCSAARYGGRLKACGEYEAGGANVAANHSCKTGNTPHLHVRVRVSSSLCVGWIRVGYDGIA